MDGNFVDNAQYLKEDVVYFFTEIYDEKCSPNLVIQLKMIKIFQGSSVPRMAWRLVKKSLSRRSKISYMILTMIRAQAPMSGPLSSSTNFLIW